jgi:nicotinate-nucleotide adenylyltransferase
LRDLLSLSDQDLKVGVLGGSFNPPHIGHLGISKKAIDLLGLDYVCWLVTPSNPIKNYDLLIPYDERIRLCQHLLSDNKEDKVLVSDIEKQQKLTNTFDSLNYLIKEFRRIKFVWIMGADCLEGFHLWYKWQDIFNMIHILVFDREINNNCMKSISAVHYVNNLVAATEIKTLLSLPVPAWGFIEGNRLDISSSDIRRNKI